MNFVRFLTIVLVIKVTRKGIADSTTRYIASLSHMYTSINQTTPTQNLSTLLPPTNNLQSLISASHLLSNHPSLLSFLPSKPKPPPPSHLLPQNKHNLIATWELSMRGSFMFGNRRR